MWARPPHKEKTMSTTRVSSRKKPVRVIDSGDDEDSDVSQAPAKDGNEPAKRKQPTRKQNKCPKCAGLFAVNTYGRHVAACKRDEEGETSDDEEEETSDDEEETSDEKEDTTTKNEASKKRKERSATDSTAASAPEAGESELERFKRLKGDLAECAKGLREQAIKKRAEAASATAKAAIAVAEAQEYEKAADEIDRNKWASSFNVTLPENQAQQQPPPPPQQQEPTASNVAALSPSDQRDPLNPALLATTAKSAINTPVPSTRASSVLVGSQPASNQPLPLALFIPTKGGVPP